ncbi:hypothetical protein M0R45_000402 [Rubus argutus]|uniref:Uncharacterized protein n=1 Tax=Rubus argutus TaxID=59490 RepID=A0AAW1VPE1_RUBAR
MNSLKEVLKVGNPDALLLALKVGINIFCGKCNIWETSARPNTLFSNVVLLLFLALVLDCTDKLQVLLKYLEEGHKKGTISLAFFWRNVEAHSQTFLRVEALEMVSEILKVLGLN